MSKGSWIRPGKGYQDNYDRIFRHVKPLHTVSIVAQGQSWREWVPGDETWAVNAMALRVPHDLLFHMDDCRVQESRAKLNQGIGTLVEVLRSHPRFITCKAYLEYAGAEVFPLQAVVKDLGRCYFNSTVAYAVAYAIYRKVKRIQLYGADFTYPNVHRAEMGRGCVEYWLGVAESRGIDVVLPETTTLFDMNVSHETKPYGFCDPYTVTDTLELIDKPLPTADEIEARYN